jgi:hypothetical protein
MTFTNPKIYEPFKAPGLLKETLNDLRQRPVVTREPIFPFLSRTTPQLPEIVTPEAMPEFPRISSVEYAPVSGKKALLGNFVGLGGQENYALEVSIPDLGQKHPCDRFELKRLSDEHLPYEQQRSTYDIITEWAKTTERPNELTKVIKGVDPYNNKLSPEISEQFYRVFKNMKTQILKMAAEQKLI